MNATIWHNPKCGTSRKALAVLQETDGVTVRIARYLDEGWDRATLQQLFADAGLTPREALRVRGTSAEQLGLTDDNAGEEAILDAMITHPILVERPFVRTDKGAVLCRPLEKIDRVL